MTANGVATEPSPAALRPFAGMTALVTGGARGLGREICRELGRGGAAVVLADVRGCDEAVTALVGEGIEAAALPFDITSDDAVAAAMHTVCERYGGLDVLVNNAGTDVTTSIEQLSLADFDRVLGVNLRAPFVLTRAALPLLRERQGQVVNIVSTAAKRAWPNASAYHASKWGLLGLSHALHAELRPEGIRVTAIVAGGMRTPFLLDRFPDIDPAVLQDPANVAKTVAFALTLPRESVIPELMVLPMRETSWP